MISLGKYDFMKDDLIWRAIEGRCRLEFTYDDKFRIVEPHAHGESHDGDMRLLAWEVFGSRPGWRMFRVAEITKPALMTSGFSGPRQEYEEDDSGLAVVHCQL